MPETRFARSGDVDIAYQVVGDGPIDLVQIGTLWWHLEYQWTDPGITRWISRLASFARFIMFDPRGTGMSDRVSDSALPTLEERMEDVSAVMDAAGSDRAALLVINHGGPLGSLFAATHPERTSHLVLYGTYSRFLSDVDYPFGPTAEEAEAFPEAVKRHWGRKPVALRFVSPTLAKDERFQKWWATLGRMSATPSAVISLWKMACATDVRHVLPTIRIPTLVVHRTGDRMIPVEAGRFLAEHIPGARLLELPGNESIPWVGDMDSVVDEMEEFLTGVRRGREIDRVLATVLFTDIVGSTERASSVGDRAWRDLLDKHDSVVREELKRHRGREVKTTGDGVLATFDGPARAIRCAHAIVEALHGIGIEVRAGLHTGEIEIRGEDVGGIAVHIGQRVAGSAGPGEVLVSRTVVDLVAGSGLEFEDRGEHALKGVSGQWRLFAVKV
ncbi:MAG: adenylate/guanylate cyclase domain-containing protein [Actinomycetota bacterium]